MQKKLIYKRGEGGASTGDRLALDDSAIDGHTVCPSIALSSSANRSPMEAPPSLARGDFAIFIGKFFLHFFYSFSSYPFLSFRPLSPFTRPLSAASDSILAALESGCGEDFAFTLQPGQQVST